MSIKKQFAESAVPVTFGSTVLVGLMLGATYGFIAGAYDVIFRSSHITVDFVVVVILFYKAIGSCLGLFLAILSLGVLFITRSNATLRNIAALITGLALCILVLVVNGRIMTLMVLPVSISIALYIARSWPRVTWGTSIAWWLLAMCIAIVLSMARASGYMLDGKWLLWFISPVVLGLVFMLGRRACERVSSPIIIIATIGIPLCCDIVNLCIQSKYSRVLDTSATSPDS